MDNFDQFKTTFMKDSYYKWNLSDDVELLKHLEKFSESIMKNSIAAGKCMDSLEESLTRTYLKVRSVSNKFHSVGDTHFVENRAHDDDDSTQILSDKMDQAQPADDASAMNEKLQNSLSTCIRILEDKFETIQLSESDSEDEGLEHSQMVLKPRKYYIDRHLPHIVGSNKFLCDSTLGLSLILQEQEDNTEAEEESGNLLATLTQPFLSNTVKMFDDLNLDDHDEEPSYQNEFFGNPFENTDEDPFRSVNVSAPFNLNDEVTVKTEDLNHAEPSGIGGSDPTEQEPYSKNMMKSMLEKIYSTNNHGYLNGKHKTDSMSVSTDADEKNQSLIPNSITQESSPFPSAHSYEDSDKSTNILKVESQTDSLSILPNIPTKVLHSLSKNRVRNHNKRRPPTRKKREVNQIINSESRRKTEASFPVSAHSNGGLDIKQPDEEIKSVPDINISTNLLSPSTDEEDLFTIHYATNSQDTSSDRLFQPLPFKPVPSTSSEPMPSEPQAPVEQSPSHWDPFSEDDEPLFGSSNHWNLKPSTNLEKTLTSLVGDVDDENLFTHTKIQNKPLFDELSPKLKVSETSLFDETDDDSLFSSYWQNTSIFSQSPSGGLEAGSSNNTTSIFDPKLDFLSDPLGFNQDDDSDQSLA